MAKRAAIWTVPLAGQMSFAGAPASVSFNTPDDLHSSFHRCQKSIIFRSDLWRQGPPNSRRSRNDDAGFPEQERTRPTPTAKNKQVKGERAHSSRT